MRKSALLALLVFIWVLPAVADSALRYRGEYTYGHEVNTFCPDINSQCYWLNASTADEIRITLKELATTSGSEPYDPVCIIVEGHIDRDTDRSGFAADYDGLVSVSRVFGGCGETNIVTQGDLQHHRWALESINGEVLNLAELDGMIPELDFGEQMTVTGNSGCNLLSGQATLREAYFVIDRLVSTRRMCGSYSNEIERVMQQLLSNESIVKIVNERQLILESDQATLHFRLQDWVR